MTIVAIHQPNFLPWAGYFHKMSVVDVFVLLDDVQLSNGKTYSSRTRILAPAGPAWLTVPVRDKSRLPLIAEARIDMSMRWRRKHLGTLRQSYQNSAHFSRYFEPLEALYAVEPASLLSWNLALIERVRSWLGISNRLVLSSDLGIASVGAEKILAILRAVGATQYVTGTGAGSRRVVDQAAFEQANIELQYQAFSGLTYPQLQGEAQEFTPNLSVLDLLFCCGESSSERIASAGKLTREIEG